MRTEPTNGLSLAEVERLAIMIEECTEASIELLKVAKEGTKILRFGYSPAVGYKNREALTTEMGDVLAAFELMFGKDVKEEEVIAAAKAKREKLKRYTKHQS